MSSNSNDAGAALITGVQWGAEATLAADGGHRSSPPAPCVSRGLPLCPGTAAFDITRLWRQLVRVVRKSIDGDGKCKRLVRDCPDGVTVVIETLIRRTNARRQPCFELFTALQVPHAMQ